MRDITEGKRRFATQDCLSGAAEDSDATTTGKRKAEKEKACYYSSVTDVSIDVYYDSSTGIRVTIYR